MSVIKIKRSYFVCATQRCGSTVLTQAMEATGQAGSPAEHLQYIVTADDPGQGAVIVNDR